MRKTLKICWTCSDFVRHQHRTRFGAWLCGRTQYVARRTGRAIHGLRSAIHGHLFGALPISFISASGELPDFEGRLLRALAEQGVWVYRLRRDYGRALVAIMAPMAAALDEGRAVELGEEVITVPLKRHDVRWEEPVRRTLKTDRWHRSHAVDKAVIRLVRHWRFTMDVRCVWLRQAEMRWELQLMPYCTLRNLAVWLLTRDADRLQGVKATVYRARVTAAVKGDAG